jgi:hypothetical protein
MLFIMATILMIQLQSFHRLFLVFAVAPRLMLNDNLCHRHSAAARCDIAAEAPNRARLLRVTSR